MGTLEERDIAFPLPLLAERGGPLGARGTRLFSLSSGSLCFLEGPNLSALCLCAVEEKTKHECVLGWFFLQNLSAEDPPSLSPSSLTTQVT